MPALDGHLTRGLASCVQEHRYKFEQGAAVMSGPGPGLSDYGSREQPANKTCGLCSTFGLSSQYLYHASYSQSNTGYTNRICRCRMIACVEGSAQYLNDCPKAYPQFGCDPYEHRNQI
ncbi:uncharacterized protein MEPE_06034 [Melanopsichium pennsylvanicum]|uniref:Uncharacterized protein n=1 Tax=Melanopsichium pennsylvanicum TaxID=63383 RepID=A0AAJ4XQJ0_9BASI|nr:uncharacterized protein MEPE_06034 [Melanopsichium pennsylvanicum]